MRSGSRDRVIGGETELTRVGTHELHPPGQALYPSPLSSPSAR